MGFRRGGRFYNLRDRANGRGTNRNGQSYTAIKKATTDSKKTAADLIDAASKEIVESITGSNGGYVVQRPAKNPQETLYMDTPDVTTAKNVMRLNKDGIAFSTNASAARTRAPSPSTESGSRNLLRRGSSQRILSRREYCKTPSVKTRSISTRARSISTARVSRYRERRPRKSPRARPARQKLPRKRPPPMN